jgi:hypothetical protein
MHISFNNLFYKLFADKKTHRVGMRFLGYFSEL